MMMSELINLFGVLLDFYATKSFAVQITFIEVNSFSKG